jgi:hypothetical protein
MLETATVGVRELAPAFAAGSLLPASGSALSERQQHFPSGVSENVFQPDEPQTQDRGLRYRSALDEAAVGGWEQTRNVP